jgi:hypothetical protein
LHRGVSKKCEIWTAVLAFEIETARLQPWPDVVKPQPWPDVFKPPSPAPQPSRVTRSLQDTWALLNSRVARTALHSPITPIFKGHHSYKQYPDIAAPLKQAISPLGDLSDTPETPQTPEGSLQNRNYVQSRRI